MAEYVNIGGSEGYAFVDPNTNELVTLDSDQPGSAQIDLRPATPEEIEGARRGHAAAGGGQKTLAVLEQAASGATFGLSDSDSPEAEARRQVLGQQNPILSTGARVAGSLVPSLAAGAVTGGVGTAVGLGGRALGAATFAAEELTQATAFELSEASQQDREIEVGNIAQGLLEGAAFLGIGRMASKLARRGAETATEGVEAAADASSALARARGTSAARDAAERSIPTRAEALDYAANRETWHAEANDLGYQTGNNLFGRDGSFSRAHSIQYKKADVIGKMQDADAALVDESVASVADQLDALAARLTDKKATSAPSAAGASSIRAQAANLRRAAGLEPGAGVSLEGRTLEDLGALPIEGADDVARVKALKENPEFAKTGRVASNDGRKGITLVEDGGSYVLRDGRHRLTAAQELGREDVYGQVVDGRTGKVIFEGPIPLQAAEAGAVEDVAIAMDQAKRHLDNLREKYGASATRGNDPLRSNVKMIDDVLEGADDAGGLRRNLEDSKIWGKTWAEKQAKENRLWTGKNGIIESRAIWQNELMERAPGAAGKVRQGLETLPVFQMQGDMTERLLALNPNKRRQVLAALENDLAKTEEMTDLKAAIGGEQARAAIADVKRDVAQFREAVNEVRRIESVNDRWGNLVKKSGRQSSTAEDLIEAAPIGGAFAGGPIGAVAGVAVKGLKKQILERITPENPVQMGRAFGIDDLRAKIAARNEARASGKFAGGQRKDLVAELKRAGKKVTSAGRETLTEAAGGTAAAGGALALASVAAETEAVRQMDEQSKRATERSMLALGSPDLKLAKLPPMADRFQGDYPSLTAAYEARGGQLKQLADDPTKFIAQVTAAFQPLAQAGHPELAAKLITRMTVGMQYLLANQPPALASSMFQPEGSGVDEVAVLQFAPIWEAVWHPLDTVRDVGTRSASPRAVKALQEVHPDVYRRVMMESFRTLAQSGPAVDFETKRYLDNVFGFGAAVGRSFSPATSNLLAQARQDNQTVQQRLGGDQNLGPTSANEMFSKGPSALQDGR